MESTALRNTDTEHVLKWLQAKLVQVMMVIVLACTSQGCFWVKPVYFEYDKQEAEVTIGRFHKLYNERKYEEMYDMLSTRSKQLLTLENFKSAYSGLHREFGPVIASRRTEDSIKMVGANRLVTLVLESRFEKGIVRERFEILVGNENVAIDYIEKPILIKGG